MSSRPHSTRPRRILTVAPTAAWSERRRLFSALEDAFDVAIAPASDAVDASAAIVFGGAAARGDLPTLVLPATDDDEAPDSARPSVRFADHPLVDAAVRGATLEHLPVRAHAVPAADGTTLAWIGRLPVWVDFGDTTWVGAPLDELAPGEALRERLRAGSFLPLLPVVQFLRRVVGDRSTRRRPRAAFLFDDPNLHGRTYGFLDFERLVVEGDRVGYHVAFASIPLDMWYASRSAVALFRDHPARLSLLVHGNDHVRRELARPRDAAESMALLMQARRRVETFERRFGLPVARVMAPPHGACAETVARELPAAGFEALCVSRPFPWLPRPPADRPLAGWGPTDVVAGGVPIIPRLPFRSSLDEIRLRAFLGQPLVLYGHHDDLRENGSLLAEVAHDVSQVGTASWMSLDEIVATSFDTWRDGSRLVVRLHARRAVVDVPDGVEELQIEAAAYAEGDRLCVDGREIAGAVAPAEGVKTVEIRVLRDLPDVSLNVGAATKPWPLLRRGLTETRDRLLPRLARR